MKIKYLDRYDLEIWKENGYIYLYQFDLANGSGISILKIDKELDIVDIIYFCVDFDTYTYKEIQEFMIEIKLTKRDIVGIEQMNHTRNMAVVRQLVKRIGAVELVLSDWGHKNVFLLSANTILTSLKKYSIHRVPRSPNKEQKKFMTQSYIVDLMENINRPVITKSKKDREDVCDAIIQAITLLDRIKDNKVVLK